MARSAPSSGSRRLAAALFHFTSRLTRLSISSNGVGAFTPRGRHSHRANGAANVFSVDIFHARACHSAPRMSPLRCARRAMLHLRTFRRRPDTPHQTTAEHFDAPFDSCSGRDPTLPIVSCARTGTADAAPANQPTAAHTEPTGAIRSPTRRQERSASLSGRQSRRG
ncbi:hypothetical protein OH76DRAFT_1409087 [Lentinus brumalis]|uniref:Uncharacterized protein n=1 Tax=Lentinus brumalis TaxID=2498619 RepID=A0A371CW80_9APHY|nr:hypothetical protein OH76DRAFT_1409087 [Polyporus brumalis]